MIHRGPDDAGEWWSEDGQVGLGHRRLSILDLSPLGHQPMVDSARGLTIAFNGEIYNHRELHNRLAAYGYSFRSRSDTEVLLAAYAIWGEGCLEYLNGMFAFALYDARHRVIFLARDRVGEKPLFFCQAGQTLRFASELKALLADPTSSRRIDQDALDCYLALGFVPGHRCILQGYNKLPAAHAMSFQLDNGKSRIWRYWSLPQPAAAHADDETLLSTLETLLEKAVGRQLVADVPVGVLLSGGLDSSLVTALAVRNSDRVRTFSIGFPGHGELDETKHARLIAHHFGTEHLELMADPAKADLIPRLVQQFDEPMADSSMIPTCLVSHLVRQHCTVALGGDGGDELFAGYPHYCRLLWMQQHLDKVPRWMRRLIASASRRWLPQGYAGSNLRTWLMALGEDLSLELPMVAGHFDDYSRAGLMRPRSSYRPTAERIRREYMPRLPDLLQRATRMDFTDYLTDDLLVKVDRASMLNSIEIRSPLLDHRLVEFAFGQLPSHLKATTKEKKIILKRLAARLLPPEFDQARKQGFSIPLTDWLKGGPFRELFWDTLSGPDCLFDSTAVQGLLRGQDRGYNNSERLFSLVQFELWRRHYRAIL